VLGKGNCKRCQSCGYFSLNANPIRRVVNMLESGMKGTVRHNCSPGESK
jgi:hypothetical protein